MDTGEYGLGGSCRTTRAPERRAGPCPHPPDAQPFLGARTGGMGVPPPLSILPRARPAPLSTTPSPSGQISVVGQLAWLDRALTLGCKHKLHPIPGPVGFCTCPGVDLCH